MYISLQLVTCWTTSAHHLTEDKQQLTFRLVHVALQLLYDFYRLIRHGINLKCKQDIPNVLPTLATDPFSSRRKCAQQLANMPVCLLTIHDQPHVLD